jgi:hypothetical protein
LVHPCHFFAQKKSNIDFAEQKFAIIFGYPAKKAFFLYFTLTPYKFSPTLKFKFRSGAKKFTKNKKSLFLP